VLPLRTVLLLYASHRLHGICLNSLTTHQQAEECAMCLQVPAAGGFRPPGALGRRSSLAWEPLEGTPAQAHHHLASFRRTDSAGRRSTRSVSGISHRSVRQSHACYVLCLFRDRVASKLVTELDTSQGRLTHMCACMAACQTMRLMRQVAQVMAQLCDVWDAGGKWGLCCT
jgi:hypothetical protein